MFKDFTRLNKVNITNKATKMLRFIIPQKLFTGASNNQEVKFTFTHNGIKMGKQILQWLE